MRRKPPTRHSAARGLRAELGAAVPLSLLGLNSPAPALWVWLFWASLGLWDPEPARWAYDTPPGTLWGTVVWLGGAVLLRDHGKDDALLSAGVGLAASL